MACWSSTPLSRNTDSVSRRSQPCPMCDALSSVTHRPAGRHRATASTMTVMAEAIGWRTSVPSEDKQAEGVTPAPGADTAGQIH
jgi:hypothetical protein